MEVEEGKGRRLQLRLKKVSMEVEEGKGRRFQWRSKNVRGEGFNEG